MSEELVDFAARLLAFAVDDAPMDAFLNALTALEGVDSAMVFTMDNRTGQPLTLDTFNQDPAIWPLYRDHFGALDPWKDRGTRLWRTRPFTPGSRLTEGSTYRRSAFYNEFIAPLRILGDGAGLMVDDDTGVSTTLMLYTRFDAGDFDEAVLTSLRTRAPAIRSFLALRNRTTLSSIEASFLQRTVEQGGSPAVLVDHRLRVVAATAGFDAPPRDKHWRMREGYLQITDQTVAADIMKRAALTAVPAGPPDDLVIPLGEHVLETECMLVRDPAWRLHRQLLRLSLCAASPEPDSARRARRLAALYRLTGAEADIALALAEGESIEAIAERRLASRETVRTQIRDIRRKLDCRSQAAIVTRVLSL